MAWKRGARARTLSPLPSGPACVRGRELGGRTPAGLGGGTSPAGSHPHSLAQSPPAGRPGPETLSSGCLHHHQATFSPSPLFLAPELISHPLESSVSRTPGCWQRPSLMEPQGRGPSSAPGPPATARGQSSRARRGSTSAGDTVSHRTPARPGACLVCLKHTGIPAGEAP